MRSWVVALALSLLATSGMAGSPAPKLPVFPSELDLVKVTVTVRDSRGNVVSSLKPEDFAVFEDGQPQTIGFFARAMDPQGGDPHEQALAMDLGMIIDTSLSMQRMWSLSQQAAIRFLESVPRAHDLMTLFVNGDIRLSHYDSSDQQGLFEQIMESGPRAGRDPTDAVNRTAIYDAVSVYLSRIVDGPGRKVAVLFTDGMDTSSTVTFPDLMNMVRASSVLIYAIGFKGDTSGVSTMTGERVLSRLATATGGAAYFPNSYREIPAIYDRILADLTGQYVLGFTPVNTARDGKFRKIKVTARGAGLKVQCREGYVAVDPPRAAAQ